MMKYAVVQNITRPLKRPPLVLYCRSFWCRLRGMTFRRTLSSERGLLLVQGKDSRMDASIHMMFVWMDLAVVWINSALEVVDVQLARPWHLAYAPRKPAQYVLEVRPELLEEYQIGDRVEIHEAWLD